MKKNMIISKNNEVGWFQKDRSIGHRLGREELMGLTKKRKEIKENSNFTNNKGELLKEYCKVLRYDLMPSMEERYAIRNYRTKEVRYGVLEGFIYGHYDKNNEFVPHHDIINELKIFQYLKDIEKKLSIHLGNAYNALCGIIELEYSFSY